MPVKTVENQYKVGEHLLSEFKIDKNREFVRGKAGPYTVLANGEREVFIIGRNEKEGRDWTARYLDTRFWITVYDGDEKWTWPVHIIDKNVRFSELPLVEKKDFEKKMGKTKDGYLSMDDLRKALSMYEQGKLHLADRDKALERTRFEHIKDIVKYSQEVTEAGGFLTMRRGSKPIPRC